jgi:hypothetical protein
MKVGASFPVTSTPSQNAPLFLAVNPSSALATPTNLDFEMTGKSAPASASSAGGCFDGFEIEER